MPVTVVEIEQFADFAKEVASRNDGASSLEDCLRLWREQQEMEETIADVLRGVADIEAGRYMTLEEADRRTREELGWPPRER
jgi:hypothetical protein